MARWKISVEESMLRLTGAGSKDRSQGDRAATTIEAFEHIVSARENLEVLRARLPSRFFCIARVVLGPIRRFVVIFHTLKLLHKKLVDDIMCEVVAASFPLSTWSGQWHVRTLSRGLAGTLFLRYLVDDILGHAVELS